MMAQTILKWYHVIKSHTLYFVYVYNIYCKKLIVLVLLLFNHTITAKVSRPLFHRVSFPTRLIYYNLHICTP